jgi:hypothetical protein
VDIAAWNEEARRISNPKPWRNHETQIRSAP